MIANFKTTLFGYSKKGVCEYIAEINEEITQMVSDLKKENKRLAEENENLRQKIQELENK